MAFWAAWPEAKGPGYVLDDATAERIGELKKREIEKKEEEDGGAAYYRGKETILNGLGRAGVAAMPIFIVVLIFSLLEFAFKKAAASSDGTAAEPAESEEIDLSRYLEVAGPRPTVRDDLIVAKATPDIVFYAECLGWGVVSVGAFWLFILLVLWWGWDGAGEIFLGIAFGLVLLFFALVSPLAIIGKIRMRRSPLTLDYLISRIKVRDGLTLPKLSREKDSSLDVDVPEEVQRRLRDLETL